MNVDITQIPYADIKANSLIVVRMPEGTQTDLAMVDQIASDLRGHIHPACAFLITRESMEIAHLDEATMNRAGWYRQPAVPFILWRSPGIPRWAKPLPDPLHVGRRVRVTEAFYSTRHLGKTGTVTRHAICADDCAGNYGYAEYDVTVDNHPEDSFTIKAEYCELL